MRCLKIIEHSYMVKHSSPPPDRDRLYEIADTQQNGNGAENEIAWSARLQKLQEIPPPYVSRSFALEEPRSPNAGFDSSELQ